MDGDLTAELRFGTSGWSYADWVGPFYPEGTKPADYLSLYAERFDTVEVDATFYAVPAARTFEGWRERTPAGFLFAPKVPGSVTHGARGERPRVEKVLVDEGGELETFLERVGILGDKAACVLFQFPYFRVRELPLSAFLPRLEATLERVPKAVRIAVEVRNKSWLTSEYLALLREHAAAAVLLDHPYMPKPEEQLRLGWVTADFSYIRLLGDRHGIEKRTKTWDRVVEDRADALERWGRVLGELVSMPGMRRVVAYANNHYAGHAPATVRELAARAGGAGR